MKFEAMDKKFLWLLLFALTINVAFAQVVLDRSLLNAEFGAQVKSLDEFKNRFNGHESKQGIAADSMARRNNIINLFDFNMDVGGLSEMQFEEKLNSFLDSIENNNVTFEIASPDLVAECRCKVVYNGKPQHIVLLMRNEPLQGDSVYRWCFVGARDLDKAGIINTEKLSWISAMEHEIHFMGLSDILNDNASRVMGYRSCNYNIDQLSVFLALLQAGALEFDYVEELVFHSFAVPEYIFTIEEIVRTGQNSGWLISNFMRTNSESKLRYINKLYGYE